MMGDITSWGKPQNKFIRSIFGMRYSFLLILVAAVCAKATLFPQDSFVPAFEDGSFSSALLKDSTYVAADNDEGFSDFYVPFESDLSWDLSNQSPLDSEKFTIAGNPDIPTFTCGSENGPTKSKLRKRDAALCTLDGASHDYSNLKMPTFSDIDHLFQQKSTIESDQAPSIAIPGIGQSDDNDSCPPPYTYSVCCTGFRLQVTDVVGLIPSFMAIQGCSLSEFKQSHSIHVIH